MLDTLIKFYQSLDAVGRTTMITTPILLLAVVVLLVAGRMAIGLGFRPDDIYTVAPL